MQNWIINTVERRMEDGVPVITRGSHTVKAASSTEAILSFRAFPSETIESVVKEEEVKPKKNK